MPAGWRPAPPPDYPLGNGAGWSSLVARRAHNPKVVGSNPTPATIEKEQEISRTPATAGVHRVRTWFRQYAKTSSGRVHVAD